ncbi:hypothetical protein ZWY2020_005330 [Hordeum vulgare]|nr:hypothetical protein ZWY2020_005330 [Hordeum vulgare]
MAGGAPSTSRRDRISELPDDVLGHILSYLPNDEAGRAAALARRWRDIFGHVHTVSFQETEGERGADWDTYYYQATERKSCSGALLDGINAALLCRRRRSAGGHVPLRTFRFAFDDFMPGWDGFHVDQWLRYVLEYAGPELNLDLRFAIGPICTRTVQCSVDVNRRTGADAGNDDYSFSKEGAYLLPRRLFSCATLKTLCLAHCRLKLLDADSVHLPALETLRLTSIHHDPGKSIQRLILSSPRLADLTLEDIRRLKTLSILPINLRRFALRCCHNAQSIHIDASEMVAVEYHGGAPSKSLLTLHGAPPQGIPLCTVDLCTPVSKNNAKHHAAFRRFLSSFSASKRLHLHHGRLHTACLTATDGLPLFPQMTTLVLQGRVESRWFVSALHNILDRTPNLEVLSLCMAEKEQGRVTTASDDGQRDGNDVGVDDPDEASFSATCLRVRIRKINMVHYDGNETQRTLARLLFRNANVLERLCVVFTTEYCFPVQTRLRKEIESWARAGSKKTFL